ncbi:integrase family protein [Rhizobium leguminosarum]|uniref:integrase family protein n=1 Tax=Rhizobium leguminosarum TaxID=384 RepID=UPI001C95BB16|nr:integrase family protein [Rhizobium leguminosarum]
MPKLYLTDSLVLTLNCQAGRRQEFYWDHPVGTDGRTRNGSVSGLGLRVTNLGRRAFIHDYRLNGERYRKILGTPANLSVASARLLVGERLQQLEAGKNPDADAETDAEVNDTQLLTVRHIIDRYWESYIHGLTEGYRDAFALYVAEWRKRAPKKASRRGRNIKRSYVDFGTMFANRSLASIKPVDIERYQKQFLSPYSHNDALKHIRAVFNWAIRMQLVDMRNPCDPIRLRKVVRQRRDYSTEQIRQIASRIFYPVLEAVPEIEDLTGFQKRNAAPAKAAAQSANDQMLELCNLMGILFLTMARPSDLATAKFEHFDLDKLIWHKHNTKGIKLSRAAYEYAYRSVPIHSRVAEMVRAQRARWPESELVFPSHADPALPRDNFRKGLARFKALPDVPDHFQLYDLKRIAISLMLAGQGVSHEAISHYVDHKGNLETTMIYDLGLVDPLRPVSEKLGVLLGV